MNVTYPYKDGTAPGYLALPATQTGAGVLVCHAWWGLNDFFKGVCDRLADAGFVAFAPDLYGGKVATTIAEAEAARDSVDRDVANKQLKGAVQYLRTHPSVKGDQFGLLGCSLGAFYGCWVANNCPKDVGAVVLFYGTGAGNFSKTRAAFLGHFAENDDFEDPAYIAKMKEKLVKQGRDVTFHVYPDTAHWFFESDVPAAYKPDAAALAWERTIHFLREKL